MSQAFRQKEGKSKTVSCHKSHRDEYEQIVFPEDPETSSGWRESLTSYSRDIALFLIIFTVIRYDYF